MVTPLPVDDLQAFSNQLRNARHALNRLSLQLGVLTVR
jgi:hypothetical protein